jgi:beta-glucanase (GH16 family)
MPTSRSPRLAIAALVPALLAGASPLLTSAPASASAEGVSTVRYLSDLPWISAASGYGPAERDRSNGGTAAGDGGVLSLQGKKFAKGVGVHAASQLTVLVPEGCTRFNSVVGVDDAVGHRGSVMFSVTDGSQRRFASRRLTGSSANVSVAVPVTPGNVLRLVVSDAGDGIDFDHADWADARFTCTTPAAAPVAPAAPAPAPAAAPASSPGAELVPNPGAESDVAGWSTSNAALTRVTSPVRTGSGAFRLSAPASGHVLMLGPRTTTGITPGAGLRLSAWVRSAAVSRNALFQVDWGSSTGYLSTGGTPQVTTSTSGWTQVTGTLTVPAGASTALFYVKFIDAGSGDVHFADDLSVQVVSATESATSTPSTSPTTSPTTAPTAPTAPASPQPNPTSSPSTSTSTGTAGPSGQSGTWTTLLTDEFNGAALDAATWNDHEPWQKGGYVDTASWNPSPHTAQQIAVSGGQLSLKARRGAGLPQGKNFTSAHINSRGKFSIPAGVTSYTEARIKAPSGRGLLPGFWLLGNGDSGTGQGWPITGEIDILEFANNNVGEAGSPFFSLWYPKDVYTAPPGTFMNATHVYHTDTAKKRFDLYDSYHTWGLLRSPEKMELYIDGVRIATYRPGEVHNGNIPLPKMLFTNAQHVRLSLIVGGWGGTGWSEAQYQEGNLDVDYVKVWQKTG